MTVKFIKTDPNKEKAVSKLKYLMAYLTLL